MVIIRRSYIFLVCAVSLQAALWAVIPLLGDLLTTRDQTNNSTALQIALIVISLPIFLAHWWWAQRWAANDVDERAAVLRRLYLYLTLAASLAPFLAFAFDVSYTVLALAFGVRRESWEGAASANVVRNCVGMVALALVWLYHQRVIAADHQTTTETDFAATIRRFYLFAFSATGLAIATLGIIQMVRWVMFLFNELSKAELSAELARLLIGVPLWLLCWLRVQQRFASASTDERESVVRKIYLYVVVFAALAGAISSATIILAGLFRKLLGLLSSGDIRDPLAIGIVMAVWWAYHTYVLRRDVALATEVSQQAAIRRLYLYLVAALSLAAFLVGLGGDLSVLIRSFTDTGFGSGLKEQLAWFSASLVAGLVVWVWPWRQAQNAAINESAAGAVERRSFVRKLYLYIYLFAATMTVLASAVYILYRLLSLALGEKVSGSLFSDLAQAIAFMLIAIGVWLYHGYALRVDGRLAARELAARRQALRVAIVDVGEGRFGRALLDALKRELPGLACEPIGLTAVAAQAMGMSADAKLVTQIAEAGLIVGPWQMVVAGDNVTADVANAIAQSPARKLLVPSWDDGWAWVGAEHLNSDAVIRHTTRAVKQVLAGEDLKSSSMSIGTIIGIVVLVLIGLCVLGQVLPILFRGF